MKKVTRYQLLIGMMLIFSFLSSRGYGELIATLTTTGNILTTSGGAVAFNETRAVPVVSIDAKVENYISASLDGCSLHWDIYKPGNYKARGSVLEIATNLPWLVIMAEGVGNLKKEGKWLTPDVLDVAYALTEDPEREPLQWKTPADLSTDPFFVKQMGVSGNLKLYLWAQISVDENDPVNKKLPYIDLQGFRLTLIQLPIME